MGSEYKLIENILLQPEISSDNIDSIPSNIFSIFLTNYHCLKVFTYHLGNNSHVSSEFPAKISWIVHIWVFFWRVMNLVTHPLGARLYTRCTAIFERNLKYFHQLCKKLVVTVSHQILVVNSGFLIHNRWRTTKQTKNSKCRKTCYVFDVSVRPNQNPFSEFT